MREWLSQNIETDNKDRSVMLKTIQNVRKAFHWVPAILERLITRLVGDLVKPGQHQNLMSPGGLMLGRWERLRRETTTIVGTQIPTCLEESGATPLIQIRDGSSALFHLVLKHTIVKKVIHRVSHMLAI